MAYPLALLVVGAVASSVSLVLVNKIVFLDFPFVVSLSTLHFFVTFGLLTIMSSILSAFEPKPLPARANLLVALFGVSSIVFMNYSLEHNSVGTYQMLKLCIIPVVLVIQALVHGVHASTKIKACLVVVVGGVGASTVSDVDANPIGLAFGCAAVVATAQYQIWQGSKQKEYDVTGIQLAQSVSAFQILIGLALATFVEGASLKRDFWDDPPAESWRLLGYVALSCALAVSVNVHSFLLIGRTSAVTWQVVGHAKTILIVVGGALLFPSPNVSQVDALKNLGGMGVALVGAVVYSNVKVRESEGEPDWIDACRGERRPADVGGEEDVELVDA